MSAEQKNKNVGGIVALVAMTICCLLLIGVAIFALTFADEPGIAFLCGGIGFFGLIGCIVLGVVMIRQNKQGITAESKRQWETGVLTDKVIKKDLYAQNKAMIISLFAMTGVLTFFAILAVCFSEEITDIALAVAVTPFVTLFMGIKAVIDRKNNLKYRIETDRVLSGEVKTTFDAVDAVTTHLPTRTPVLNFENHGEYKIYSIHIHEYYPAEELVLCIEPGEEVFIVYSVKTNEILHIYRKKYWELKEG